MPVKLYEISISDRKIVYRALAYLTQKFINSFAPDDISELSDDVHGMMNVTLRQCYVHSENKYGRLDQSDFDKIFETLQSPKLPTQDFAALADVHRDMHQLLASSNQVSTEYMKTQYFMQAIKDDPAGRYLQQFPYIPDHRRFTDLFATVIRHAPTYIATNVSLGYSSALSSLHCLRFRRTAGRTCPGTTDLQNSEGTCCASQATPRYLHYSTTLFSSTIINSDLPSPVLS